MKSDILLMQEMNYHVREALKCLGAIHPAYKCGDIHNVDTPVRIVKAWLEMTRGLGLPDFEFTLFPSNGVRNWIVKKDIEFSSMCAHHFLPFIGKISIGYVPIDSICGISKLDRVVDYFSKRPQVQEQLGEDIRLFLVEQLGTTQVVVIIESLHTCVACRGIESRNSTMITTHSSDMHDLLTLKKLI